MTMSIDDMSFSLDHGTRIPRASGLPYAWQATADNRVTRHYAPAAGPAAVNAGEQVRVVDHKLNTLKTLLGTSAKEVAELEKRVNTIVAAMRGPESELATANQALIDLQKRNDAVIAECGRWKKRALAAEKQAEEALEQAQKQAETPSAVFFIRRRTPGDSVRYLAGEVMKHAEGNLELAGLAQCLRMVAVDVDSLPQGTP
jgi:septal ring factor EnvC (AmiA/AmiB activator)